MRVVRVDEALQVAQVLLELLREFQVLLIAPGAAERMQLSRQGGRPIGQVLVELLEHLREQTQLAGIDNGLSHDESRVQEGSVERFGSGRASSIAKLSEQAIDFATSLFIKSKSDGAANHHVRENALLVQQVFFDGQESVESRLQRDER